MRLFHFKKETNKKIKNSTNPSQEKFSFLSTRFNLSLAEKLNSSVLSLRSRRCGEYKLAGSRWFRPEVYPLFAAIVVAVGICGLQLVRNICINPEVRVNKQSRAAGVLENCAEGEKYSDHFLRKYVRNRAPEIMPSLNNFFTDPKQSDMLSKL